MSPKPIPRSRHNTNEWNRRRYRLWAPVYDLVTSGFNRPRQRAIELLQLRPGESILLAGAGTGLDLDFLPPHLQITAVDLTPAMIARLEKRAARLGLPVTARVMDAQRLDFPDGAFDAVLFHLILAVVPDPVLCLREAARVLKPGGRAVVLDKFLPQHRVAAWLLRLINPLMGFLASEVTRRLEDIVAMAGWEIVAEEPARLRGLFRLALLRPIHRP